MYCYTLTNGLRLGQKFERMFVRALAQSVSLVQRSPKAIAISPLPSSTRFVTATSGFAKDLRFGSSTVMRSGCYGDDASFVEHTEFADVIGVADGVGGWRKYGVDPSKFSRNLMKTCARYVREGAFSPWDPVHLLSSAYAEIAACENRHRYWGSSTACIVVLDHSSNQIHTANLGDSGFYVLRNGRVIYWSEYQQHHFNTPFQLSLPPHDPDRTTKFLCDSPEAAESTSFDVEEDDLVLVATDGLFDNMPPYLIESEISKLQSTDQACLQSACNSIALQARCLAFDNGYVSPFAQRAKEHYGINVKGGKPDDITVVLAAVKFSSRRG